MNAVQRILAGCVVIAFGVSVWWYLQIGTEPLKGVGEEVKNLASTRTTVRSGVPNTLQATPARLVADRVSPVVVAGPETAETSLAAALAEPNRFQRQQVLERLGYDASIEGAAAAILKLEEITAPADRAAFVRGMFAKLAEGPPSDAMRLLKEFRSRRDREAALGALVEGWRTEVTPGPLDDRMGFIYETEEGRMLAKLVGDPLRMVEAARELARGNDRLRLIQLAATAEAHRDPQRALSYGQGLQGEERSNFLQTVALEWGRHHGEAALTWALQETDPVLRARLHVEVLEGWGLSQPEQAARQLGDIADPAARQEARQTIAAQWAMTDTQAALQWANGLSDVAEREHTVAAIQTSAPVGIGVALTTSPEGLPMVRDLIPGSPASAGGMLKPGYQIAAIGDGKGGFTSLQGVALDEVTKLIRGRPGTSAVLQIIPPGGTTSNPLVVAVPRRQLFFKAPAPGAEP